MSKKLILGIFIIAFGGIASLYIVGSAEEPALGLENFLSANFLESVQKDLLFENVLMDEWGNPLVRELPADHNNLTDILANAYARYLVENMPEELRALEAGMAVSLPIVELHDVVDEVFERRALAIVADFRQNKFGVEDVLINPDNSIEAHEKYVVGVAESFSKNLKGLEHEGLIIDWMRTGDPTKIVRYYRGIFRFLEEVKTLRVPLDWVDFHLNTLNFWHKKYAIFKAMPEVHADPLKFVAAINSKEHLSGDLAKFLNSFIELAKKIDKKTD